MEAKDFLRAPFPYFGGKAQVANKVWAALGDVKHYMEPFFGSGAVLLARPNYDQTRHIETVCDKDGFVANVWRALQFAPDEVARWCDWPVNHADLAARRRRLTENESRLLENLIADENWFDAKLAGYWIWAASCWIGSGLTSRSQIPHLADSGKGVHALGKRPHVSSRGMGIHALGKRPLGDEARREIPDVRNPYNPNIYHWFRILSERLRYVRVVCGDWTRICGGNWQDNMGTVGIFFDPPYGVKDRDTDIYHHDSVNIAADVLAWARERGKHESYRIVIAGYEEYEPLIAEGWRVVKWKAMGGYGKISRKKQNTNRFRERLYISPHCLPEGNLLA